MKTDAEIKNELQRMEKRISDNKALKGDTVDLDVDIAWRDALKWVLE